MKIAVIGTGNVGGTLGSWWAKNGHQVVFGTRNPNSEKVQKLLEIAGDNAGAKSVSGEGIQHHRLGKYGRDFAFKLVKR